MKFIHTADLHLDSKIESLPTDKSRIIRDEIVHAFERLADYATDNGVTAIIIAGDMFDTAKVTTKTRGRVFHAIEKNPSVDFLYLSGNHDDEIFLAQSNILPKNLKIFDEDITTFKYDNVCISGIKFSGANVISLYDNLNLCETDINIVALHGQVAGYNSNEKAEIISIPKLKNKNVDYLALGHIHSYSESQLDERGRFAYSGCLSGRGFDELGDKGFVLLDVSDGKVNPKFVKFSLRNFCEFEFDVSGKTDWYKAQEELLALLGANFGVDSLIKVILKGEHDTSFDIDKEVLSARLNERYFFAKVYDKTELKIDLAEYENDKSVRGEFVRTVWNSDMSSETKRRVIMIGLNALKGEEI